MKKAFLLSLAVLFLLAGCAPKKSKDVTILCWGTEFSGYPQVLNGKVKEIKANIYWAVEKNGQVEKGAMLTLKELNDSGISQDFQAFYNDSGVLLRHDYLGDNSQIQWSHVNEIKNGRVIKENWIRNDSIQGYATFNYNDKGFITGIPMHWSQPDSSSASILALTCDEKGNMTQMKVFNQKDVLTGRTEYKWNEKGSMTKMESFLANDSLVFIIELTYNDHGFFDKVKTYDGKDLLSFDGAFTYTYDKKGNYIRAVWNKTGKPWLIEERTYVYY